MTERYDAHGGYAGWFVSAVGIIGILFGATMGLFVARFGARRSVVIALGCGALVAGVEALNPPAAVFLVCRILEGASHLALVVAIPTALPGLATAQRQAIVAALWGSFFTVAFMVGGFCGPWMTGAFGLSSWFAANGCLCAVLTGVAFFAMPKDVATEVGEGAASPHWIRAHTDIYRDPRTAGPAFCFVFYTMMFLALQTLTPALVPAESRAMFIVAMPAAGLIATLAAGAAVGRRYSPFGLAIVGFAAMATTSVCLHLAVASSFGALPAAMARMAAVSLLPGAIFPIIPLICRTPELRARAFGAVAQLGNVGSALGPPMFNASLSAFGPLGLLWPALSLCAAGAVVTRRVHAQVKR